MTKEEIEALASRWEGRANTIEKTRRSADLPYPYEYYQAQVQTLDECAEELRVALAKLRQPSAEVDEAKLFIDCEFNGKGGELISMALVAEDGREFYEVVQIPDEIDPWVAEHVIPVLYQAPIRKAEFQARLRDFLASFHNPMVISDWPVDIAYLCEWVIVGEYPNCTAPMIRAISMSLPDSPASAVPHNALSDARAIHNGYLARARSGKGSE